MVAPLILRSFNNFTIYDMPSIFLVLYVVS